MLLAARMRATWPAASYRSSHGSAGFCSSGDDGGDVPLDAPPLGLSCPDLGSPHSVDCGDPTVTSACCTRTHAQSEIPAQAYNNNQNENQQSHMHAKKENQPWQR
jgi:hypothetical protein